MKRLTIMFVAVLMLAFVVSAIYAKAGKDNKKESITEANVWTTEDGAKHFNCPVMGGEGVVDSTTTFSDVDGKRYYHCCPGCIKQFKTNSAKLLEGFAIPGNVLKVDKDGKHFKCVVSGKNALVSEKTLYSDLNGKRYYYCCPGCKPKFEAEPQKYLKSDKKKTQKS